MRLKFSALILLSCLLVYPVFAVNGNEDITTFILVRHAEKVDDSYDPDLSEDGYLRVQRLTSKFERVKFDAVYSTPLIRTTETARGIADANDISIMEYDHREPEKEVEKWLADHRGRTVLISGHSNSTPAFANKLLGREHFEEKFDESDYGNLLIITIPADGEPVLLHLRF